MEKCKFIKLLTDSNALLKGHFLLTSGRHSNVYIEKFRLIENPKLLDFVCKEMVKQYINSNVNIVIGAAVGGILIAGSIGRHLGVNHIFTERINGKMVLRRGFNIQSESNVLIVEDIVTTGGSIFEIIEVVKKFGGNIVGITSILDRNHKIPIFGYSYSPLISYPIASYIESDCPDCKNNKPLDQRGRTGKK